MLITALPSINPFLEPDKVVADADADVGGGREANPAATRGERYAVAGLDADAPPLGLGVNRAVNGDHTFDRAAEHLHPIQLDIVAADFGSVGGVVGESVAGNGYGDVNRVAGNDRVAGRGIKQRVHPHLHALAPLDVSVNYRVDASYKSSIALFDNFVGLAAATSQRQHHAKRGKGNYHKIFHTSGSFSCLSFKLSTFSIRVVASA